MICYITDFVYFCDVYNKNKVMSHSQSFILKRIKGTATEENWEGFLSGVKDKAAACRRIAEKYGLEFIPLQDKFDALCEQAPESYWLCDGVHPTPFGHELIAREWLNTYEKIK